MCPGSAARDRRAADDRVSLIDWRAADDRVSLIDCLRIKNPTDIRLDKAETIVLSAVALPHCHPDGEINALRAAEFQRQERAAFEKFSSELQDQLGPNIPSDYAKTSLLAMAAQDRNLEAAWRYRGLTNEELATADRKFRQLEALHFQVQHSPDTDPRKPQTLAMLEQRGREL